MNKLYFLFIFLMINIVCQSQTANDTITPYNKPFKSGVNPGWYGQNWNNYELADIMGQNAAAPNKGIGIQALRTNLPEDLALIWDYKIWEPIYDYYNGLGLKDNTLVVGVSAPIHRDKTDYCPSDPSPTTMFANLYEPIWDGGANGTPVNDENYFALYVYNLIQTVGDNVKFWEIWNEPGFDLSGKSSIPKGQAGNWWDNDPDPCDFIVRAPIYHYIRTLRIAYEVIKTLSPDDYIVLSGVGNDSFLDALLRNSDNPNGGDFTNEFPLGAGAYFDVMGFHAYPSIDGSVREWDNNIQNFIYSRHSDGAVNGFEKRINARYDLLEKYGYNGTTYPKKLWTITEYNVPRKAFGDAFGSAELQRNYVMKMALSSMKNKFVQSHLYAIGELEDIENANDGFQLMGLYERLNEKVPGEEVITEQGIAYATTNILLNGLVYDEMQTQLMDLPINVEGGAFKNESGQFTYMLWAKTATDQSENATAYYGFPSSFNFNLVHKINWDYSKTSTVEEISSYNIPLNGTPIFIMPDQVPNWINVVFSDGNVLEGTGTEAEGGKVITWANPVIESSCDTPVFNIEIFNLPDNNFFPFGETTVSYKITDACGTVTYASILVKVASTGGPGGSGVCHPHHYDFNFLGSFEGHKYLLTRTKYSIEDAKVFAAQHGGQLVSLETEEENDFLKQQLYEVAVIGLSDSESEGELKWENGEPVTYTKLDTCSWCGTNTENNDYLEFHPWNGQWSFVDNSGEYYFVVELTCEEDPVYALEIQCPEDIEVNGDSPEGALVHFELPSIIKSECPNSAISYTYPNDDWYPTGTTKVSYYLQDDCGNTDSCTIDVTVIPWVATTTVSCQDDINIETKNPNGAVINWSEPIVVSNCPDGYETMQIEGPDSGTLLPIGSTKIKYRIQDLGEWCSTDLECEFYIHVVLDSTVSTGDILNHSFQIQRIYPNPIGKYLNIQIKSDKSTSLPIEIRNNLGQVVFKNKVEVKRGVDIYQIDLHKLRSGFYFLKIKEEVFRLVKTISKD